MEMVKKFFPFVFQSTEVVPFVISLVVYALVSIVCGVILGLLSALPIIGILFSLIGTLIGLYALAGIVLSILVFVKVIK